MKHPLNTLALLIPFVAGMSTSGMSAESSSAGSAATGPASAAALSATIVSLDGDGWLLATDPQNVGRDQQWWLKPQPAAQRAPVPWIIQGTFPGYHGVAWYWRDFSAPANPHAGGQYLLRFGAVDYLADVWLNDVRVGGHEGGETPFELDVTGAIRPGANNRLAVRVLNPTNEPIDGIALAHTARRCKVIPYAAGAAFNHGGIVGPVELAAVPAVRITDLHIVAGSNAHETTSPLSRCTPHPNPLPGVPRRGSGGATEPDATSGRVRGEIVLFNAAREPWNATLELAVAPAAGGPTLATARVQRDVPAGETRLTVELTLAQPRQWELNDPFLYRATARVQVVGTPSGHERSTRFGFRDFRFADGYFRLNGRRLYLRSTHTCNHFPLGQQFPHDPDLVRRDLLNLKAMGFNMVRFIWGGATPTQLDYCDEIGLLVYEESFAAAPIADSPQMAARFDSNVAELIRRDRNHPSVVIWGLLNEAPNGPAFHHAVAMLPLVRGLDATRMVFLNSGRYDHVSSGSAIGQVPGLHIWPKDFPTEPWVAKNVTPDTIRALGITWPAGQLAFHPGPGGEYSVVRWIAPAAGHVELEAVFTGIAEIATTDVHVLHNGQSLFGGWINLHEQGNQAKCAKTLVVAAGDRLDFAVGYGNGHYGADSTALAVTIRAADGKRYDATADFSIKANPNGVWSYGRFLPAAKPDAATFACYPAVSPAVGIGSLSNPGSKGWEDVISDRHVYPRVPHTAEIVTSLRTLSDANRPVFLSEYGIGSAVDLWRAVRHFEQRGAERLEDAQFFAEKLNEYLADYQRWRLDEVFVRPEDFFAESLRKMAGQRTLGLNAIRANPNIVGHSLTGAIDHVMCGEGLTTLFRELKPGTVDALFDAWYPLRWCLFAEPAHLYRGEKVRLEALLADEDTLAAGEYPARLQVVGPDGITVFDRTLTVTIPARSAESAAGRQGRSQVGWDSVPTGSGRSPNPREFVQYISTRRVNDVEDRATGNGGAQDAASGRTDSTTEPPLATRCLDVQVPIDGPAGRYRFVATFLRGAAAAGGSAEFYVTDRAQMPPVDDEIAVWGEDARLVQWLSAQGIRHRPYGPAAAARRATILACGQAPGDNRAEAFRELVRRIACGSTVVFLIPEVFAEGNRPGHWLPLEKKGQLSPIHGWLYLKDEWSKRHPIFAGLPTGGLMDYAYYRELIPDLVLSGQDPPAEAAAGAIKASQGYASGLTVAVYRLGAGRFILNTLRIRENLGRHPAAERLLRNMLNCAAQDAKQPPVPLPAGFDAQLKALGYGP